MIIIAIMSAVTFILFGVDKYRAIRRRWRIPEATLLLFTLLFGGIGGLLGILVFRHKTRKRKFRILVPLFALWQVLLAAFFIWTADYYHADPAAVAAMEPDARVEIRETKEGWLFDGPAEDTAIIFYPGAKVEPVSYAPLLHKLAETGADVFLVKMPLNLAFLGTDRAGDIIGRTSYRRYYIGGHSLGGAMAANYASAHDVDGVILLAAYPVKELDTDVLLIYGTEDRIVNKARIKDAERLVKGEYTEFVIEEGNHARFGNYGKQAGDGQALITAEEQQGETVRQITDMLGI